MGRSEAVDGPGSFRLGGLIAAPHTPMDERRDLRLSVIEQQAAALVRGGVRGAFICGTTGEGLALTTRERMAVAERWLEAARDRLKVIVHVGHPSGAEAADLARHARSIGAAAIATLPPLYFKPASVEQLVEFCRPIADAAGELPLYYYHIPSLSGVNLPMAQFLEAAAAAGALPTLRGIKFTHMDMMEYQRCLYAAGGRFEIAWGVDEMLLGALAVGAESAVGSTYNYSAPLYLKLIDAFASGDLASARACSRRIVEMIAVLLKYGGLRTGKAIMSLIGIDCGPPRSPVPPLSAEELEDVKRTYARLGFFEDANVPVP